MHEITLYVGKNDKNVKKQIIPDKDFLKCFDMAFLDDLNHCYTVNEGCGCYRHTDNTITHEECFIITILTYNLDINSELFKNAIYNLKRILNQESILLTKQEIQSTFM